MKKKLEFNKIIIGAVLFTYFVGLGFAIWAVQKILIEYPQYAIQALVAMFGYIASPVSVAIGFYSWKAKNENVLKITNNIEYSQEKEEE